jgi:hypothetical protein
MTSNFSFNYHIDTTEKSFQTKFILIKGIETLASHEMVSISWPAERLSISQEL